MSSTSKPQGLPRNYRLAFPLCYGALRAMTRLVCPRFRVSGRSNLPYGVPVLFASNHLSDFDPPLIASAARYPLCYMAKGELWEVGWLRRLLNFMGCIPVDPGSPDRGALKACRAMLAAGESVVIFPEGKLSTTSEMGPILPGTVSLALSAQVPIVPIGIWGVQYALPYGEIIPRTTFKPVRLHFGAPLHFDDLQEMQGRQAREIALERLEIAMRSAVEVAKKR